VETSPAFTHGTPVVVVVVHPQDGTEATPQPVLAVDLVVVPVKRTAHLPVERLSSPITVGLFKYGETLVEIKL
jgi:hypothetical protein